MPGTTTNPPKHREYPCHPPDCKNLVFDNRSPNPDIVVMGFGNVLVFELLLGGRVKHRNEHVGDYTEEISMITSIVKQEHVLFSPTNGRLHSNTSLKFGNQYGCDVQLN